MQINCVICSDLFVGLDDVFGTQCGHLFHYQCLIQWIERSQSCPQCRAKTTEKNIHRVYFNVPSNAGINDDPSALQNRIDSLHFQLRLKDTDIKNVNEKCETLSKQNGGLREEIKTLENKIRSHEVNTNALKEQLHCLRKENKASEQAAIDVKKFKEQLQFLRSVELVVKGTATEVEDILDNYKDASQSTKSLATFVSVLKREINSSSEKRRELVKKLKVCEHSLDNITATVADLQHRLKEQNISIKQLEQDLKHSEEEKHSLKKKMKALQHAIMSPTASNPSENALRRLITESPVPETMKRPKLTDPIEEQDSTPAKKPQPYVMTSLPTEVISKPVSPYLNVKMSSIGLTPLRPSHANNMFVSNKCSIFNKARLPSHVNASTSKYVPEESYDGLGGHSRLDEFPTPNLNLKYQKKKVKSVVPKITFKGVPSKTLKMDYFLELQK